MTPEERIRKSQGTAMVDLIRAAVAEERQRCARLMCGWCRKGAGASRRVVKGHEVYHEAYGFRDPCWAGRIWIGEEPE